MIKRLTIEGFKNIYKAKTYTFDKFNMIVGPVGAGKSTVLECLMIALTGKHPYLGNNLKAIAPLVNSPRAFIEIEFVDGTYIRREYLFGEKNSQSVKYNGQPKKESEIKSILDSMQADFFMFDPAFISMNNPDRFRYLYTVFGDSLKIDNKTIFLDFVRGLQCTSMEALQIARTKFMKTIESLNDDEVAECMKASAEAHPVFYDSIKSTYAKFKNLDAEQFMESMLSELSSKANSYQNNVLSLRKMQSDIEREFIESQHIVYDKNTHELSKQQLLDLAKDKATLLESIKHYKSDSNDIVERSKELKLKGIGLAKELNIEFGETIDFDKIYPIIPEPPVVITKSLSSLPAKLSSINMYDVKKSDQSELSVSLQDLQKTYEDLKEKELNLKISVGVLSKFVNNNGNCPVCNNKTYGDDLTRIREKLELDDKEHAEVVAQMSSLRKDIAAKEEELRDLSFKIQANTIARDTKKKLTKELNNAGFKNVTELKNAIDEFSTYDEKVLRRDALHGKYKLYLDILSQRKDLESKLLKLVKPDESKIDTLTAEIAELSALNDTYERNMRLADRYDTISNKRSSLKDEIIANEESRDLFKNAVSIMQKIKKDCVVSKVRSKLNNDRFTITEDVFGYDNVDAKALSGGERIKFLVDITKTIAESSGKKAYMLIEATDLDLSATANVVEMFSGKFEFMCITSFYNLESLHGVLPEEVNEICVS